MNFQTRQNADVVCQTIECEEPQNDKEDTAALSSPRRWRRVAKQREMPLECLIAPCLPGPSGPL